MLCNPSGSEAESLQDPLVIYIHADALAPFIIPKSSAAMVLTRWDKQVIFFHKEGFQLSASSQCWKMIVNTDILLSYFKMIQHVRS